MCKCVHTGSLRSNKVLWETAEDQNNRHALPVTSPDFTRVSLSSTVSFVWVFKSFFLKKVCWYCVNHKHKHQISTFQTLERGHVWLENLTKMLFLKNKNPKIFLPVDFSSGFNFYLFMELAVGPFHSLPITAQQLQRHTERKQKVFYDSQWNSEFEEKTFVTKSLFFLLFYRWVC